MSSTYRILCVSHDPALTTGSDYNSPEAAEAAIRLGVNGHPTCDLLIGRYSYPLRAVHRYVSTACWHELADHVPELHGSCRARCKYCDEQCRCPNHPDADDEPNVSWVDQARDVAVELLAAARDGGLPAELEERIRTDRSLFWLRGEVQPPGEWREP